jgi:hypothetical protein
MSWANVCTGGPVGVEYNSGRTPIPQNVRPIPQRLSRPASPSERRPLRARPVTSRGVGISVSKREGVPAARGMGQQPGDLPASWADGPSLR